MGRKPFDENIHFWPRVKKTKTCWMWIGYKLKGGYGQISIKGIKMMAHRWSYEKHNNKIPKGMTIDHICNNPPCVNPNHLQILNQRNNNLRNPKFGRNKTHCPQGHEYTEENTYYRGGIRGDGQWRDCKECVRRRGREYRARLKEKKL